MNSKLKRTFPFDSSSVYEVEPENLGISGIPLHKKMSIAAPSINITAHGQKSSPPWTQNAKTTANKRDSYESYVNGVSNVPTETQSQPVSRGRKNMKNLQLVVPPVRSSISAPNSPQLPQNSGTHTHNRRPSTPICIYQNKPSEQGVSSSVDPMALMSRTENAIGEESPYKEEPICILPNLYLGSELNAANRPMLDRLNIEFIINVGKEVEIPYMGEIASVSSFNNRDNYTYTGQVSPGLSISSSASDNSYQTAASSPIATHIDSPMIPSSPLGFSRNNSIRRAPTLISSRSNSLSLQFSEDAVSSGPSFVVPATDEFKAIKYKKFFWTHNQENLISDFKPAFAFIDEARSTGRNILVHCQCGVSRSASLVIGYVMKANRMTLNQAYEFVKDRSPCISPNMSLVYQLVDFEKTLKLGNNSNTPNVGTPTKSGAESARTHSRSSSIESDLLLKSHRRSASLPRKESNGNTSGGIESPPRTPGIITPDGLLSVTTTAPVAQATVKGGPGRFHVITASISQISPVISPTPTSTLDSLSPTSSTSSPTTPTLEPAPSATSHSRRSSKPSPLLTKRSSSSLLTPSKHSSRSRSPSSDRVLLSALNTPMSPVSSPRSPVSSPRSTSSISITFPEFDQVNYSLFPSYSAGTSPLNNNEDSNIFGNGKLDNIFSPTRTSSPVTTPRFSDLWASDE